MDVMREHLKMKVQIKTLINFKRRAMRREKLAATDRETSNNNDADTDAGSSEDDGNNSQGGEESRDNESPVKLSRTILDSYIPYKEVNSTAVRVYPKVYTSETDIAEGGV